MPYHSHLALSFDRIALFLFSRGLSIELLQALDVSLADLAFVKLVPFVLVVLKHGVAADVVYAVEALKAVMLLSECLDGEEHHEGNRLRQLVDQIKEYSFNR